MNHKIHKTHPCFPSIAHQEDITALVDNGHFVFDNAACYDDFGNAMFTVTFMDNRICVDQPEYDTEGYCAFVTVPTNNEALRFEDGIDHTTILWMATN